MDLSEFETLANQRIDDLLKVIDEKIDMIKEMNISDFIKARELNKHECCNCSLKNHQITSLPKDEEDRLLLVIKYTIDNKVNELESKFHRLQLGV